MRIKVDEDLPHAVVRMLRDKGFADIRQYAPGTHAGILLLRPDQDGIGPVIELLEMVLASYDLELLAETVAVATPRGIRVRRTEM